MILLSSPESLVEYSLASDVEPSAHSPQLGNHLEAEVVEHMLKCGVRKL